MTGEDEFPKKSSLFFKMCNDSDSVLEISVAFSGPSATLDNLKQKQHTSAFRGNVSSHK